MGRTVLPCCRPPWCPLGQQDVGRAGAVVAPSKRFSSGWFSGGGISPTIDRPVPVHRSSAWRQNYLQSASLGEKYSSLGVGKQHTLEIRVARSVLSTRVKRIGFSGKATQADVGLHAMPQPCGRRPRCPWSLMIYVCGRALYVRGQIKRTRIYQYELTIQFSYALTIVTGLFSSCNQNVYGIESTSARLRQQHISGINSSSGRPCYSAANLQQVVDPSVPALQHLNAC